ncbi:MAG: glucose-6-phosphate dehydrogenase [Gemmatimonadota bacterium]
MSGERGSEADPAPPAPSPGPGLAVADRGLLRGRPPEPCLMVIFGASGDLTHRALLPSLFELYCKRLLPESFAVVGTARRAWDSARFRQVARETVRGECAWHPGSWEDFARRLHYVRADAAGPAEDDYARLQAEIERVCREFAIPGNVFFHLAVPPSFFGPVVTRLGAAGLAAGTQGWRRLVIEKPFGEDLESARTLDRELRRVFEEDQIYRIDHFLGKETVQNMLVFRFANPAFEPIWNRNYIDHVQITAAESIGIGTRAGFYEKTGVVRDMVQNHLLQLLCMTAIEPPVRYDAGALRDETVKVLKAVDLNPLDPATGVVLGQYGPGRVDGVEVPGYQDEEGVAPGSRTPTFAALKLTLDNWRWADVPFYLRTGKRLTRKLTEVSIHFKPTPHLMFDEAGGADPRRHNVLTFEVQPEEGIVQTFVAKQPGPEVSMQTVTMNFRYADAFGVEEPPRAYAWLLLDVMQGEQTLFARADWVHEAWKIVDPITSYQRTASDALATYPPGSSGPSAAAELLNRDGRRWRPI